MSRLIDQIEAIKIDSQYDATYDDMKELKEQGTGSIEFAYAAFKLGYARGSEAEAEAVAKIKKELDDNPDLAEFMSLCRDLSKEQLQKVIKKLMDMYIGT
jgi:hypothetical protein